MFARRHRLWRELMHVCLGSALRAHCRGWPAFVKMQQPDLKLPLCCMNTEHAHGTVGLMIINMGSHLLKGIEGPQLLYQARTRYAIC